MMTGQSRRRDPDRTDEEPGEGQMGFLEHLDELRTRIIRSCFAIGTGMLVAFMFVDRIADFILAPTLRMLPPGTTLIYTKLGEGFSFYLDVALIGGVVLAMPFVMYQVWRFIAPALHANEKKFVIPFVVLTTAGSLGGALFSHYVLFPGMVAFFGTFNSRTMKFAPRVEDTFDMYKNLMLGMVVVFQLPTLVFFLARMRLVTARLLWRNLQYAILAIFIIAAVLTPSTDPWNQTAFAAPMIALYLLSIGIAWLVGPKRQPESDPATRNDSPKLRLVFAAAVIDQAWKHRRPSRGEFPRRPA
jgi:sec-independent protein translocase protein TatC